MEEPKPIKIRSELFQDAMDSKSRVFADTTTWINYLVEVGLNFHLGLDPYGRLGKPTDREKKKEGKGGKVLPIPYIEENRINKEKLKKWIFTANQISNELDFCKDLIVKFWEVKSGTKSHESFNILNGERGLLGIYRKYGKTPTQEQLEEAIANRWQSITLKNYEAYGRPKNADKEPITNHPAGKVFTASDIYKEN